MDYQRTGSFYGPSPFCLLESTDLTSHSIVLLHLHGVPLIGTATALLHSWLKLSPILLSPMSKRVLRRINHDSINDVVTTSLITTGIPQSQ